MNPTCAFTKHGERGDEHPGLAVELGLRKYLARSAFAEDFLVKVRQAVWRRRQRELGVHLSLGQVQVITSVPQPQVRVPRVSTCCVPVSLMLLAASVISHSVSWVGSGSGVQRDG